ncbi:hypothetical protein ACET3Z_015229 [Daucus carota]
MHDLGWYIIRTFVRSGLWTDNVRKDAKLARVSILLIHAVVLFSSYSSCSKYSRPYLYMNMPLVKLVA